MHSAFGARNVLFLAPLHTLSFAVYCDVASYVAAAGLPHSRIKLFYHLRISAYICGFKVVFIAEPGRESCLDTGTVQS